MPLKKSIRLKKSTPKSTPVKTSTPLKDDTHLTQWIGAGAIATVVICIVVAAMVIGGAHKPSRPTAFAIVDTRATKAAPAAEAKKSAATTAMTTMPNAPAVESTAKAPTAESRPVTVTGCLERADETFRLKDATGEDAPKSRSWKSGFLKKGSASIEVVDAANRVKLADHVGQRVSVTGTLVDRELQLRSLHRVAASCSDGPKVRT